MVDFMMIMHYYEWILFHYLALLQYKFDVQ